MLENIPSYKRNFVEGKKSPDDILTELELIQYKKPVDKPECEHFEICSSFKTSFSSSLQTFVTAVSFTSINPSEKTY